jgi:hypothetical protein
MELNGDTRFSKLVPVVVSRTRCISLDILEDGRRGTSVVMIMGRCHHAGAHLPIERALHAVSAPLQDMRVDLCRPNIGMAQQLLDRAQVIASFE